MNNTRLSDILIKGYKEDYEKQTGRHIRIEVCTKWESVANFTEKGNFWAIIKLLFEFTGWTWNSTFGKAQSGEPVFRRGIADFICTNNGITLTQCARETGRNHTTIIHSIESIEVKLGVEMGTQKILREICEYLGDNYYLYKDKSTLKDEVIETAPNSLTNKTKIVRQRAADSPKEVAVSKV